MNRDPLIAQQILDMGKTEAQRREEQGSTEHAMLVQAVSQNPSNDERTHTPHRTRHDYTR